MQKEITVRPTKSCKVWPHTVTSIYTCVFQRGCSCFTTRNYFAVVLTCPFDLLFSQTHRITNGCNLFAEQPRHTTAEKNEYFVACFGQASLLWESHLRNPEPIYCLRLRDCESFTLLGFTRFVVQGRRNTFSNACRADYRSRT